MFGTVFVADLANDSAAHEISLANLFLASTEYEADKDEIIDRDSWKKVRYKFELVLYVIFLELLQEAQKL